MSLRICFAMPYYDARTAGPDVARYLARLPIHRELPRALAERGHRVDVVYHYPCDAELELGGARHRFVAPGPAARAAGLAASALGRERALLEPALRMAARVRALAPDVVHVHGLTLTWNLLALRAALGRRGPPVVVHYHGGFPPTSPPARAALARALRGTAAQLFTTRAHAEPFVAAGLIPDGDNIVELVETSSDFRQVPREEARRATGMAGDPVCLWAGRLHAVKDPLTALRGFELIAAARPGARLYMHYLTAELEPQVRAFLADRPALAGRVELRGRAPLEAMPAIYSSADFLLQASLREFSGCAVLEAMACGAIPAVTAIPSFRAMTSLGRYGVIFQPGDHEGLARGVLAVAPESLPAVSAGVRGHFEAELSFPAMARQLEPVYLRAAPPA